MDLQMDAQNLVQKLRIQAGQLEFNLRLLYAQKQAEEEYKNHTPLKILSRVINYFIIASLLYVLLVVTLLATLYIVDILSALISSDASAAYTSKFINVISTFPLELQAFIIVLALLVILGYYIQQNALQKQILKKAKREQLIKIGEDTLQKINIFLISYDQRNNG